MIALNNKKVAIFYCPVTNARLAYLDYRGFPLFFILVDNVVFLDNCNLCEVVLDGFMGKEWRKAKRVKQIVTNQ